MNTPEISVIMPVYNASRYLGEAIESILNQTFKNFELIILNDKSTDNSLEIIKKYQAIDKRIILIEKETNSGPANLRNEGINIAQGEFIALMDADDISQPQRFEKQLNVLHNIHIDVCGSWFTLFGTSIENSIIKHFEHHDELKINFLIDCYIGNPTAMFRKKLLNNTGFKNEFVPMEDYELWSRIIQTNKFHNIQESLLNYRWHETNISHTNSLNRKNKHNTIRLNQLHEFQIESSGLNTIQFLNAIQFTEKQSPENIISILKCRQYLIEKNKILKKYNTEIFNNLLDTSITKTITKAAKYNKKLLFYILKNETIVFNKLKFIEKFKIIFKSLFL